MAGTENFYAGSDYGLDPNWGSEFSVGMGNSYKFPSSQFGFPTDPRTSNQIKAVSDKLSTGAKVIEVSGVSAAQWENIPDQHLDEINRLRKLVGTDLTFHGPLVEPTGVTKQGWNESHRMQAERQMWSAVQRAHKLDPTGNIVVTFHSSNGIPDPEVRAKDEQGNEQIKEMWVVDEKDGNFRALIPKPDYFKSREGEAIGTIEQQKDMMQSVIDKQNKETWFKQLQGVSFHAHNGAEIIGKTIGRGNAGGGSEEDWLKIYDDYLNGKGAAQIINESGGGIAKPILNEQINNIIHGDVYLKDSYHDLQTMFNQAYEVALKNDATGDLKKLDVYRDELAKKVNTIEEPTKIGEFADTIIKGVNVLRSINPPESLKPLKEFAVDKSSDTFANLAFNAYSEFRDTAPIISVENPPAGMGLTSAEDLKAVVEASREKLSGRLMEEKRFSEKDAKFQAEKLIGVTWDVGHINMIRKHGYKEEDIVRETKKIAPFVKHVHLSDNFGMEHTEMPMGMGNVPTKPMLEAISKYNKKVKKIAETGTWFGPNAFGNQTPYKETLRAFGSPIYSMKMSPAWNQISDSVGGYFSGYGQTLPEHHFSMYGAGFSNMPAELGGQVSGRSRLSGTPNQ